MTRVQAVWAAIAVTAIGSGDIVAGVALHAAPAWGMGIAIAIVGLGALMVQL